MRHLIGLVFLLGFFSSCLAVEASDFKDQGKAVDIKVELGKVSEVVFPHKIAKIIKGGQPEAVLVEVLDNSLYLLPKTDNPPDIFVTTVSGSSYPLSLHMSQDHDVKVQIDSLNHRPDNYSRPVYGDVMDLMKDLLLHKEPAMATVLAQAGEVFLSNGEIQLTVDKAYELGDWKAYVLTAKNLINNAVIIPIEQISLPHLLAVSTDQDMLYASGQEGDTTRVYLITGS